MACDRKAILRELVHLLWFQFIIIHIIRLFSLLSPNMFLAISSFDERAELHGILQLVSIVVVVEVGGFQENPQILDCLVEDRHHAEPVEDLKGSTHLYDAEKLLLLVL